MRKIYSYFAKNNNSFLWMIFLCFITSILMPINDENKINNSFINAPFEGLRIQQYLSISIVSIIYWFLIINPKTRVNNAYKTDKFYIVLIFGSALFGIVFTLHFINWEMHNYDNAVHNAVRVWEILSFMITFIYMGWFWFIGDNGMKIRNIIDYYESNKKLIEAENNTDDLTKFSWKFEHTVVASILSLIFLTIGHLLFVFQPAFIEPLMPYSISFSVGLILLTYWSFKNIGNKVIISTEKPIVINENDHKNIKTYKRKVEKNREKFHNEFILGLKYVDYPMYIVFIIMFVYASYCTFVDIRFDTDIKHSIELFIGGAIAFELLLSSIMWARTDTW